jgi:hypothetical protein
MAARNSLLLVLMRTGGVVQGYKGGMHVVKWLYESSKAGRPLTVESYSERWRQSERTSYRERAALAASLPEGWTVEALFEALWENSTARRLGAGGSDLESATLRLFDLPFPEALT